MEEISQQLNLSMVDIRPQLSQVSKQDILDLLRKLDQDFDEHMQRLNDPNILPEQKQKIKQKIMNLIEGSFKKILNKQQQNSMLSLIESHKNIYKTLKEENAMLQLIKMYRSNPSQCQLVIQRPKIKNKQKFGNVEPNQTLYQYEVQRKKGKIIFRQKYFGQKNSVTKTILQMSIETASIICILNTIIDIWKNQNKMKQCVQKNSRQYLINLVSHIVVNTIAFKSNQNQRTLLIAIVNELMPYLTNKERFHKLSNALKKQWQKKKKQKQKNKIVGLIYKLQNSEFQQILSQYPDLINLKDNLSSHQLRRMIFLTILQEIKIINNSNGSFEQNQEIKKRNQKILNYLAIKQKQHQHPYASKIIQTSKSVKSKFKSGFKKVANYFHRNEKQQSK